jgi:hypothetical protein
MDESRKTFNGIFKHLKESADNDEEQIKSTTRFGVPWRSIELGDPFHIDNYPVIVLALYATFALMPSTTRLTEQSHGTLRDSLPMGVSMMFTDT